MSIEFSPARRFRRYAVDLLAIRSSAAPRLDRVENLSRGGARIRTRAALPVGSQHTFLLVLPGTEARTLVAPIDALVAWATAFEFGLEFKGPNGFIDDFLERVSALQPAVWPDSTRLEH